MRVNTFQNLIRTWHRAHGRHDLPWRQTRDPWRILVSEIMLQQTQVSRVLRKYPEFLKQFPTIEALGRAPLATVLSAWQGMGYNRRALYLKRLARIICERPGGRIPADVEALRQLPGIGPATAGAVCAFAHARRVAFIETNIRRVYLHYFFSDRRRVSDAEVLAKVSQTLPERNIRAWYWALMDYGALALKGISNPNRASARYAHQPRFAGSRRELRGRILAAVSTAGATSSRELACHLGRSAPRDVLAALAREGLIEIHNRRIAIPA